MPMFGLIDGNNFFASCERVFSPKLDGKPIVVLSNNDGCVIARSNEAKALGIPMGEPFFKVKQLCTKHDIKIFSSNFELYGDMSDRMMKILEELCPSIEIYSVDEAFLDLTEFRDDDLKKYGLKIRHTVKKWTGLPTSIGIAPTKVLAKVANHIAKKKTKEGVFVLNQDDLRKEILSQFDVQEIWGIGYQSAEKLRKMGIGTALQFAEQDTTWIKKHFSVIGQRIQHELQGISCLGMEEIDSKKNIQSTRSFGKRITELSHLEEAIAGHVSYACEKLRAQHSYASAVYVYIRTNRFNPNVPKYHQGACSAFDVPTHHTGKIITRALQLLRKIYRKGYAYHKAGITLLNLIDANQVEYDFFHETHNPKTDLLMSTIDHLNAKTGKESIFFGSTGTKRSWKMRSQLRSPCYTTRWSDLKKC
jgi:DNA polymerase V